MEKELPEKRASDDRQPLKDSIELCFFDARGKCNNYHVAINGEIGRGRTCICYDVDVRLQANISHKMILKQFYPLIYSQQQDGILLLDQKRGTLDLGKCGDVTIGQVARLKECFLEAFEVQNTLANNEATAGITVKAWIQGWPDDRESGYTMYALYDRNPGRSLMDRHPEDIFGITGIMCKLLDALQKLHSQRVLYIDLKPENILMTREEQIMFFDFDSAVNMDHLEHINTLSCTPMWSAPELCQRIGGSFQLSPTFEQNKWFRMTPAVDLYSAGQIFYWLLTGSALDLPLLPSRPEDIFTSEYILRETGEAIQTKFPGYFTEESKNQLLRILGRSLCSRSVFRYRTAPEMLKDLNILTEMLRRQKEAAEKEVDFLVDLPVSFVLFEHPLFRYSFEEENRKKVHVLLTASNRSRKDAYEWSPVRNEMFKQIFSVAQMPGLDLTIECVSPDAEEYCRELLIECPGLSNYGRIICRDQSEGNHTLAELIFHATQEPEKTVSHLVNTHSHPFYVLFLDRDEEWNYHQAQTFLRELKTSERRLFLGFAGTREKKSIFPSLVSPDPEKITVEGFGMDRYYSEKELELRKKITKLAVGFHRATMRAKYSDLSDNDIIRDLTASRYSQQSSQRQVLSLPYKLACLGLSMQEAMENPSRVENRVSDQKKFAELVYMEQLRWLAYMICEGYRRPSEEELLRYAYKGGIGHHDRQGRRHAAMVLCCSDGSSSLQGLAHEKWLSEAQCPSENYDDLDRCSLKIHSLCAERKKRSLSFLPMLWTQLEMELEAENVTPEVLVKLKEVREMTKLLESEERTGSEWKLSFETFREILLAEELENETIVHIMTLIRNYMQPVCEFYDFDDLKEHNRRLAAALPEIMRSAQLKEKN